MLFYATTSTDKYDKGENKCYVNMPIDMHPFACSSEIQSNSHVNAKYSWNHSLAAPFPSTSFRSCGYVYMNNKKSIFSKFIKLLLVVSLSC